MCKAVLISIKPKWCELIDSGEKTVEVRKSRPKLDVPFKCYIYQTKSGKVGTGLFTRAGEIMGRSVKNGTVIGEFVCDKITATVPWRIKGKTGFLAKRTEDEANLPERACLTVEEIEKYAGSENGCIYGWHISDLVIYDKPRELTEFYKNGTLSNEAFCETVYGGKRSYADYLFTRAVRKPPQSWCYVEG